MTEGKTLEQRVFALEQMLPDYATRADVERLEAALDEQIAQLRQEMRGEFSAVREAMSSGSERTVSTLRDEIRKGDDETRRILREEMRAGDAETRRILRKEIRAGDEETRRILREEIRGVDESIRGSVEERTAEILTLVHAGDEETRRLMRVLHEDLVARINTISRG